MAFVFLNLAVTQFNTIFCSTVLQLWFHLSLHPSGISVYTCPSIFFFFFWHLGGYCLATVNDCLLDLWRSGQGKTELESAHLTGAPENYNTGFKAGTHLRVKEVSPCLPAAGTSQTLKTRDWEGVHEFYCCLQSSDHEERAPAYMS